MADVSSWNPSDEYNNAPPPDGWPEFMMPSQVNNSARAMMGAVRRMYDQMVAGSLVLPYLKLSGGSLSGGLGINGGLTASGTVQGSYLYSTGGANVAGAFGANTVNATQYWIGGTGVMSRDGTYTNIAAGGGEVSLSLNSANNYYYAEGHTFRNSANNYTFLTIGGAGLSVTGGVGMSGPMTCTNANISGIATVTGLLTANGGISVTGGVGMSGPVTVGGNANISGIATCAGLQIGDATYGLARDGAASYLFFNSNIGFTYARSNHSTWFGIGNQMWMMDGGNFCYNNIREVGGHGAYYDMSDIRLKEADTIADATAGLDEIRQLRPVTFMRIPRAEGVPQRQELGFIAQEVQAALPLAVNEYEMPDGPALGISSSAIVAALVRAVQTIDQRLTNGGL